MRTLQQAADQLGCSAGYLRKRVAKTKRLLQRGLPDPLGIKFFQIGQGRIRFEQEWIDEFKTRNSVDPAEPVQTAKAPTRRRALAEPLAAGNHW